MTGPELPEITPEEKAGLRDLDRQLRELAARVWARHPNNPENASGETPPS
jgi:uncharacterized coiled-coil protein SlyX